MPIYEYRCECGVVVDDFRHMKDRDVAPLCECGATMARAITVPRMKMQGAPESPDASVKRLLGGKRGEQYFDNPWSNERVMLKGSKAARKAQVVKSVLDSPLGKRRKLKASDINVPNL